MQAVYMSRSLLLLLLFAHSAIAQPKPKTTLAVVEVVQRFVECTGAGGEHYVLRIHDGRKPPRYAHAGGHGSYLGLLDRTQRQPAFFLAELVDVPSSANDRAPCLEKFPAYDAHARRLVRAKDAADAEKLRARGLPGPTPGWGTTVVK
jgi:hypothetical protein